MQNKLLEFKGKINKFYVNVLLDTDAHENFINPAIVQKLNLDIINFDFIQITLGNGKYIEVKKYCDVSFKLMIFSSYEFDTKMYLLDGLPEYVHIGFNFIRKHKINVNSSRNIIEIEDPLLRVNKYKNICNDGEITNEDI
ncbi:hypothetical protein DMUE_0283 [Dictyocoela muelleri]|nr:hypothetical protein DMUE_0283 [Dictyocoela muelleri]